MEVSFQKDDLTSHKLKINLRSLAGVSRRYWGEKSSIQVRDQITVYMVYHIMYDS